MKDNLSTLNEKISLYIEGAISKSKLEQLTLSAIGADWFEDLESEVQDIIYTIDNLELNHLSKEDVVKLQAELKSLIIKM